MQPGGDRSAGSGRCDGRKRTNDSHGSRGGGVGGRGEQGRGGDRLLTCPGTAGGHADREAPAPYLPLSYTGEEAPALRRGAAILGDLIERR
jgi:hypothetical protein